MSLGLGTTAIVEARRSGVRHGRSGIGSLGGRLNRMVPTPQNAPILPLDEAGSKGLVGGKRSRWVA